MRQKQTAFEGAKCPNASDSSGKLDCSVTCDPMGANVRLYLLPPKKSEAPVVTGYVTPAEIPFDMAACKVATPMPIVTVYKTPAALMGELLRTYPDIVNSVAQYKSGKWVVLDLDVVRPKLTELAKDPNSRVSMIGFSRAISQYQGDLNLSPEVVSADGKKVQWGEYVVLGKSAVLFGVTKDVLGNQAAKLVTPTKDSTEFARGTSNLYTSLRSKQDAYTENELKLLKGISDIKSEDAFKFVAYDSWVDTAAISK